MKPTKHNFLLPFLILAYSCSFGPNEPDTISDAELVQLIIGANKVEISMSELPNQSISTVEIDYYDYDDYGDYYDYYDYDDYDYGAYDAY